jgi:hypothetical protein
MGPWGLDMKGPEIKGQKLHTYIGRNLESKTIGLENMGQE